MSGKKINKPVIRSKEDLINDLFIIPKYDESKIQVTFTAPEGCHTVKWSVLGEDGILEKGKIENFPRKVDFEVPMKDFISWDINDPYLYTLRIQLGCEGGIYQVSEQFGMRKIEVSEDAIYLNNQKFYVRGYIRGREAHEHPNLENLPLEEYYEKNLKQAKKFGFNLVRFHSRVPSKECFYAADRLGIFIHVELRKYYGKYQKERGMMNDEGELLSDEQWTEMVLKNRNHPSLMAYCMGNEIRHPGHNPRVAEISKLTKKLDPTRLFIDTCAHGEFDRDYVDFDVQHMSYYYPFGKNYDMFDHTYNWTIYGSAKGVDMEKKGKGKSGSYQISRSVPLKRPVFAHEICHYLALRDIDKLEAKFIKNEVEKPWWIDELRKLIELKGLNEDYPEMLKASKKFQFLSWKLGIEATRRSSLLSGFHFLQLADTDKYENSNGLLDCFDDVQDVDEKEFLKFNSGTVLLADLPCRTYFEKEKVNIPTLISHFSPEIKGTAKFAFKLKDKTDGEVIMKGTLGDIDLDKRGRREIAVIELELPETEQAKALSLQFELHAEDGSVLVENDWNIWVYSDRAANLPAMNADINLDEVNLSLRYPQICQADDTKKSENLMITNRFSKNVFTHLKDGNDVLMLYRVPETRDRLKRAEKEKYYLPATWDRFKGVIWDRGTNCGAFIRDNQVLSDFPNDGYLDLQFHALVDGCDKINLDDFPVDIAPVMQGVDKAVRDRYDVYTFELPELQPEWTMRKFGYLFELKVGKGRLFVSGFNFTGLNNDTPETCAMFESILKYVTSDKFAPKTEIEPEKLECYLLEKGKQPLLKERKMTQFWQLNAQPLESDEYWKAAEDYIREG